MSKSSKIEARIHTPSLDTLNPQPVDPTPWNQPSRFAFEHRCYRRRDDCCRR